MDRSFLEADIDELVKKLRPEEKVALLAGPNWWNTSSVERLHIPAVRMSDGPNGVRGSSHFIMTPAQCLPCATSLAATFDEAKIVELGRFLAEEAKIKSSVILLAPTCNIQRSPLGGRAFESFSEDPHLSGIMAAAYVSGLQVEGVSASIKHFVANDQEHERTAADSVMSKRALREIYLYPFMLAQKYAQPWAFMTSYGRIDGTHCSENSELLQTILRDEWGFEGIVMSDWHGTYGTSESLNAGLDLEMPGPPRWRTQSLISHSLSSQKLSESTVDQRVANLLTYVQKLARRNPHVVYGDGKERSRDSPQLRAFARQLAADGIVLLKNEDSALPLGASSKTVAVIGPNARANVISGGGSAALKPTYVVTPFEGISAAAPEGVEVKYALGCYAHKYLPTLEDSLTTPRGENGWLCTFYTHDEHGEPDKAVAEYVVSDTRIKLNDFLPDFLTPTWSIKLTGRLTVEASGPFELGLAVAGRAKLFVDGKLIIDNWTKQTPGDFFYGQGTIEEKAVVSIAAGEPVDVLVDYTSTPPPDMINTDLSQPALMRGVRLGGARKIDPEEEIADAVQLARQADAVVVVAGLTPEWESEGFDRPTLGLPGLQDELISQLGKANPRTIVGSAVAMPWVDDVSAVVQAWYQGNEMGNALADVLFGAVNPSGRLPLTFPARIEDIPAYPNLRSERGKIHYREELFVGYKHYQLRAVQPLFPFGHGLSYTSFEISQLAISPPSLSASDLALVLTLAIQNTGAVAGSHVVQIYVAMPDVGATTPRLQLRGFAKARDIAPGGTARVSVSLDRCAVGFWDERGGRWRGRAGTYGVFVGRSSCDLALEGTFELERDIEWTGV
ncbi:glycoside hydrolase family 3 protein [Vararia minispora EC-137]|uniref:Glycoside hydrolase family 3 protein n=1 Tax=Vararia minispora EC-137 TaxID=1314806 RepID=A0ACB8Q6J0_9AGAM|nr:glycoside hydrolase family 3 protein [Vararia minispora EC-137]